MFLVKAKTEHSKVDYDLNIFKYVASKNLNRQKVSVLPY